MDNQRTKSNGQKSKEIRGLIGWRFVLVGGETLFLVVIMAVMTDEAKMKTQCWKIEMFRGIVEDEVVLNVLYEGMECIW